MAHIIQQLQKDHLNAARLLDLLEAQIGTLHDGETPDYLLMLDMMCYMRHYPDLFHHPKEDLVFEKLKERDANACLIVDNLMEEHKALAEKGVQFFESLQTIVSESMVPRETLESQGRGYIAFLRSHMKKEEDQAFPLASKVLREEDWAEIDTAMESKADPVFGKVVGGKYRALYDFLTQQGA
ncbi:MAG: hemerythrin domain-containing protein [Acidiferrobacterales bacterium]